MNLTRRQVFLGLSAVVAAPAIVRAANIMPVRSLREAVIRPLPVPDWCPLGCIPCDGRLLRYADYPVLAQMCRDFSSPSLTEFRVPDLRGSFLRGHSGERINGERTDIAATRPPNISLRHVIVAKEPKQHFPGVVGMILPIAVADKNS